MSRIGISQTMPSTKHKKLVKLGADTLATALLDLANVNDIAESAVDRLLASRKENAKTFWTRLAALKRRKHFVSRRETAIYARELESILGGLKDSIKDPHAGIEAIAAFFQADSFIFEQCDDSNGTIGNVFKFDAAELFVEYASNCDDKEWLVDLVLMLNQDNQYGIRDVLFEKMTSYLPPEVTRQAVEKLWQLARKTTDIYDGRQWIFAIEDLAKQLKDPLLFEEAARAAHNGELSTTDNVEIARLHLERDEAAEALNWLNQIPKNKSYMEDERNELLLAIHKRLNNTQSLTGTAWRMFRLARTADGFETLLEVIGEDQREKVIESEAKAILNSKEFTCTDAEFLLQAGQVDEAEQYIIQNTKNLNGRDYESLLPLAKAILKHDRFLAASVIYRALVESILKAALAKNYHHAVTYLKKLDSLAPKIHQWQNVQTHADYKADLKRKHKLKSSLWAQY